MDCDYGRSPFLDQLEQCAGPLLGFFLREMAVLGIGVGLWLAQRDPASLLLSTSLRQFSAIRRSGDKVFMVVDFYFLCVASFPRWKLDAVRYEWSSVPMWLQIAGAICLALCIYVSVLTFRVGVFAES